MSRRLKIGSGLGVLALGAALFVPGPTPDVDPPPHHPFVWGQDDLWARLEARFGSDIAFTSTPIPGGYKTEMRVPLSRPRNAKKK